MSYYKPSPRSIYDGATVMETVNGIEIRYAARSSKFLAIIGERIVQRVSLQSIRRMVATANTRDPIRGVKLRGFYPEQVVDSLLVSVIGEEDGRLRTLRGDLLTDRDPVYHYDETLIAELKSIYEEERAALEEFNRRWREVIAQLRKITPEEVRNHAAVSPTADEHPDQG